MVDKNLDNNNNYYKIKNFGKKYLKQLSDTFCLNGCTLTGDCSGLNFRAAGGRYISWAGVVFTKNFTESKMIPQN